MQCGCAVSFTWLFDLRILGDAGVDDSIGIALIVLLEHSLICAGSTLVVGTVCRLGWRGRASARIVERVG
jgi:hypothetical protein